MLQQDAPDDYVLATGEAHSVREFVERAFACTGREILWRGRGVDEVGLDARSGKELVRIDPRYFRPTEVDLLQGDPSKAHARLGWRHRTASPTWCARWSRRISRWSSARVASGSSSETRRCASSWLANASGSRAIAAWSAARWCAGSGARTARS